MSTRIIMVGSAVFLALVGLGLAFLPHELIAYSVLTIAFAWILFRVPTG